MNLSIHPTTEAANRAAANLLSGWLTGPGIRVLILAAGNTPLDLYRRIGERRLALGHLLVFALDEYVGVPPEAPRNCANLLRRTVVEPWGIPPEQFFAVSSLESGAGAGIHEHELRIAEAGGADVAVLGLGQNGHLGFNEPGSAADSDGRVLDLERTSVEANQSWFGGEHAPARGATVGLKTILASRRIQILAYGPHKAATVKAMVKGPVGAHCPASFLQAHPNVWSFLDAAAAAGLDGKP